MLPLCAAICARCINDTAFALRRLYTSTWMVRRASTCVCSRRVLLLSLVVHYKTYIGSLAVCVLYLMIGYHRPVSIAANRNDLQAAVCERCASLACTSLVRTVPACSCEQ